MEDRKSRKDHKENEQGEAKRDQLKLAAKIPALFFISFSHRLLGHNSVGSIRLLFAVIAKAFGCLIRRSTCPSGSKGGGDWARRLSSSVRRLYVYFWRLDVIEGEFLGNLVLLNFVGFLARKLN